MTRLPQHFDGSVLPFVWAHFWRGTHKRNLLVGLFFSLLAMGATILLPYAIARFIDALTHPTPENAFWRKGWLVALVILSLQVIGYRIRHWMYWRMILPDVLADMRETLFKRLMAHGVDFFFNHFAGSLANKVRQAADAAENLFDGIMVKIFDALLFMVVASYFLAGIQLHYAVIILLTFTGLTAMCVFLSRKCNQLSQVRSNTFSSMVGFLVDVITNQTAVRHFVGWKKEDSLFQKHQVETVKASRDLNFQYWFIWGIFATATAVMQCSLLWLIAHDYTRGQLSIGEITLIVTYSTNLTGRFSDLIFTLPQIASSIGTMREALQLLYQPLQQQDDVDTADLETSKGEIVFDCVDFAYPSGHKVFEGLSFTIPAGQKVGLVGFSGSGKSTLVHLLLRHYDVQSGHIKIDGQDIAQVTMDSLREAVAAVPQDPSLFHRSLYDNIAYGNHQADDALVRNAAQRAAASEFIESLSDQYATKVGERGVKLSGGQRQRIAIARAILSKAPILVLDEATSALDSVTESLIQDVLHQAMQDRTTIVIAHRLATLKNLDRLIVLENGRIVEDGTLEELIQKNGHFAQLWQMQSGGFLPDRQN